MSDEWTAEDYNNAIGMAPYDLDWVCGKIVDLTIAVADLVARITKLEGEIG